jgi:hypothetical protein
MGETTQVQGIQGFESQRAEKLPKCGESGVSESGPREEPPKCGGGFQVWTTGETI